MKLHTNNINVWEVLFICTICLLAFNSYSQQEIRYKAYSKCDTLNNTDKVIEVKDGTLQCISSPEADHIFYFTKKEEFQNYIEKNKASRDYCPDVPATTFDFDKYDVIMIKITMGGCKLPEHSFRVYEKDNHYVFDLNFIVTEKQNCAKLNVFARYFLLPKGKVNPPEFGIYKTSNKCY